METNLGAHYRLANDIDCSSFDAGDGNGFRPVGEFDWEGRFRGSLDGAGHIVSNLTITRSSENDVALFGATDGANVQQLGLATVSITGGEKSAALVGFMQGGQVTECYATGSVTGGWSAGGLVAYAFYTAIADSYSSVAVDGGYDSGLAVGIIDNSSVDRVHTSGTSVSTGLTFLGYELASTDSGAYFDCTVAGTCTASRAATTTELQTQSFLEAASYDFVDVWGYRSAGSYACLQWEPGCGGSCGTSDTTCDGVDDDCDGTFDENYTPYATACGTGVCAASGSTSCVSGAVQDSCTEGSPSGTDDSCDSVDQDCDGSTDEAYAPAPTSCGVGVCSASGATSCVDGAVEDSCEAGSGAADDTTCDSVDDDCDGIADEDYAGSSTSCGVGACAASGVLSCAAGTETDSCAPGSATGDDSDCDGVDDDCDGSVDESYSPVATSCGTGVCGSTGSTSCVAGAVVDSCEAGSPSGDDSSCNGLDDDCDGTTDEAYATVPTSCGVGVCGATGATSCVAGAVQDSCTAGSATGDDSSCDGLDADCDGTVDESYASVATSCGVGVCGAIGATSCTAGSVVDSCSPGSPSGDDSLCDGLDADCDGSTDESYVAAATSCGVGGCSRAGALICAGGTVQDSCVPGSPAADDVSCDLVDDDCDGASDEDFAPFCSGTEWLDCVAGALAGTECEDADACNGVETCAVAGCQAGTPPTIDDGNPCTADSCDPVAGVFHDPLAAGVACPDGDLCNGDETCDGSGVCVGGVPPTIDDGYPCTTDSCDPVTGVSNDLLPEGTSCSDGNPCNGEETCNAGGVCTAGLPPATGACVPAAPTARFYVPKRADVLFQGTGATLVSYTNAAAGPSTPIGRVGLSFDATPTGEFIMAVGSQRPGAPQLISQVRLDAASTGYSVRTFEVWASTTTTDPGEFELVYTGVTPNENRRVTFDIPPTPARFVRFVMVDNHGDSFTRVRDLQIFSTTNSGSLVSMAEAGATSAASSNEINSGQAHDYCGPTCNSYWSSASGDVAGAFLTVDLPGDAPFLVDAVRLRPDNFTSDIRDVEIWASATGDQPGDFSLVRAVEVDRTRDQEWVVGFEPTRARYLELRVLTNHGGSNVRVYDFAALAANRGGLAVSFQDISTAGGDPIEHWLWDFGDGSTSTAQNPRHVFPGPGTYLVRLTAVGEYGSTSSYEMLYEALQPPAAALTVDDHPVDANVTTWVNDVTVHDAPLAGVRWTDPLGAVTQDVPGSRRSIRERDPGDYLVGMTAVDVFELEASTIAVVTVVETPPEIEAADDMTLRWGELWAPPDSPTVTDETSSSDLSCLWDFGDGSPTEAIGPGCQSSAALNEYVNDVQHSWSDPGIYEASVAVTDPSGLTTLDEFTVTVVKRDTGVSIDPVPGAVAGGTLPVRVRLFDRFDASAPMAGQTVTVSLDSQSVVGAIGADGSTTVFLDFQPVVTQTVSAVYAGDGYYNPSATSSVQPEVTPPDQPDNCGTEYIFQFPETEGAGFNSGSPDGPARPYILLYGEVPTAVEINHRGLGFTAVADVVPGEVTVVKMPTAVMHPPVAEASEFAVHIRSPREVCVQALSSQQYSSDGLLALPVTALGNHHVVPSYGGRLQAATDSNLTITATQDATTVTIIPSTAVDAGTATPSGTGTEPADVPFDVVLDRFETLHLRAADVAGESEYEDLTGTQIFSTAPVAVLAGHDCTEIPQYYTACDYLVEQVPSVDKLGVDFLVAPLSDRQSYEVRIVAAFDGTQVTIDSGTPLSLDAGEFHSQMIDTVDVAMHIQTSQPALVAQYGTSTNFDNTVGDPMMTLVIPTSQFDDDVFVTSIPETSHEFEDWINVVVETAEAGGLRVDGSPIAEPFTPIATTGYSYAQLQVSTGSHRLTHLTPGVTFGAYAYGWATDDSYGYPAQLRMVPLNAGCTPTAMVAGDGVDNDCDGRADEELANGLDDDGDGLVDEDVEDTTTPVPNAAPVAYDRSDSTVEDTPLAVVLTGFDANGDSITYELLSSPGNGATSGTPPLVTYTPVTDFVGTDSFTYRAFDGTDYSAPATVTITVRSENDPPQINLAPVANALEDAVFALNCVAIDVDTEPGCDLTWELVEGPPGMTMDAATGDLFWVPPADGSFPITVAVEDCHGARDEFSFLLVVDEIFDAPYITSRPVTTATFNLGYSYQVTAADPDSVIPSSLIDEFQLLTSPSGMTIDTATGLIQWSPVLADAGEHEVEVIAIDGTGLQSQPQRFTLVVAGDGSAPHVTITAEPYIVLPGADTTVTVAATDDDSAVIDVVTIDGTPVTLDGAGQVVWTAPSVGVYVAHAEAVDPSGNRGIAETQIRVIDSADDLPPQVTLTAPTPDAELTYLHDVVGSVNDANLYEWTIDIRPTDGRSYRTLVRGTANASGTLGQVDATLLENGRYVLRLHAEDVNGQVGEAKVPVQVAGQAKLGVVQLAFTDLVIDDVGIPLALVRTYDSRRVNREGDFGHGWELEMRTGRVQHNRPLHEDILITNPPLDLLGGSLIPCTLVEEQEYHFTEVRLSDDEYYVFRPEIGNLQEVTGSCSGDFGFEFVDGSDSGATLGIIGNTTVRARAIGAITGANFGIRGNLTDVFTGEDFAPKQFRLTTRDGRIFDITEGKGIVRYSDPNGNTLFLDDFGLIHSSGRAIEINRDPTGRITDIRDGAGRSVTYEYDATGNLVGMTDPAERETQYEYRVPSFPHHLTDIIDSRGIRVAAMDYTDEGRLDTLCDADGVCFDNEYDLAGRELTRLDGLGKPTRYIYDERGRVETAVDGNGGVTQYTYRFPTFPYQVQTVADPEGNTTTYNYVEFRPDVAEVITPCPTGVPIAECTTSYTYDDAGRRTSMTSTTGGTLTYEYDGAGNRTAVRDELANLIESSTYNADGTVATRTNRFGITTLDYADGSPQPTRITEPEGAIIDFAYTVDGDVERVARGSIVHSYRYDDVGRMQFADYGAGVTVSYAYGQLNEWTSIEGPTFGRVERRFSGGGKLIGWTEPNGDTYSKTYDAVGRLRSEVDATGNVTTHDYDDAGHLERTVDAVRGETVYERDLAGRTEAVTDVLGHRTVHTRDAGRLASITDPRMAVWLRGLSSTTPSQTDPLGHSTTHHLSPHGLLEQTDHPDSTTTSQTYLGRTGYDSSSSFPLTQTDERSEQRTFSYDGSNVLQTVSVVGGATHQFDHALEPARDVTWQVQSGEVTVIAAGAREPVSRFASYDEERDPKPREAMSVADRLTRHETPEGDVTSWVYGADGLMERVDLSHGQSRSYTYDSARHLERVDFPDGEHTTHVHDTAGRELSRTGSDGTALTWSYGPNDRVTQHSDSTGTTTYNFDGAGRPDLLTAPTGASIDWGYDGRDQVTTVDVGADPSVDPRRFVTSYRYDGAGNLDQLTDPAGGVTTRVFDLAGRLTDIQRPNGLDTTFAYDSRNRITSVVHERANGTVLASVSYVRGSIGEPTRIQREDGSYVEVDYDASLRITEERFFDSAGVREETLTYGYDLDGKRTSLTRTNAAGTPTVETYIYDTGARLTRIEVGGSAIANYEYDARARLTRITTGAAVQQLEYDVNDHLVRVIDVATGDEVRFAYDAAGRRVGRTELTGGAITDEVRWLSGPNAADGLASPHLTLDASGAPTNVYLFDDGVIGNTGPAARLDPSTNEATYYLRDALGTVIALADETGGEGTLRYDAFGNERGASGPLASAGPEGDFRFHGHWADPSGLHHARARAYDPATGRFTSRDPAEGVRSRPESYAPYGFGQASPLLFADPTGRTSLLRLTVAVQVRVNIILAQTVARLAPGGGIWWIQHGHHAIPKFLQGLRVQGLYQMPWAAHSAYHGVLHRVLLARGLPSSNASAATWRSYFINNPGSQRRAFQAMLDAAKVIDERFGAELMRLNNGRSLVQQIWRNIYSGEYVPY